MAKSQPVAVQARTFEEDFVSVMARVQTALAALLDSLPETIRRPVDLERALRIDKKLAWQVVRLSRDATPGQVANVPSLVSMQRVVEAAQKKGVDEQVLQGVGAAIESFENLASIHGGDRRGLISMVSGLTGDKSEQYELNVRKSLFRGNAHIWGAQARMAVRTGIFIPRSGTNRIEDGAMVIGDIGLLRRRQSEPLVMLWWLTIDDDLAAPVRLPSISDPCNPAASGRPPTTSVSSSQIKAGLSTDHGLRLLPEFSSSPLPRINQKPPGSDGMAETELVFPPGRSGAITMYSTHSFAGVTNRPDTSFFARTLFTLPLEAMVWELLVPVGWSNPATARAGIYGRRHHPELVYEQRTVDLMDQRVSLDYLGVHEGVPLLPGAPTHAGAVRHVLETNGWWGTRFDVYRCRVEYPVLHTLLECHIHPLPQ